MPVFINIRDLSPLHSIHTDSGAHKTPLPIHTRCTASQVSVHGVKTAKHWYLVLQVVTSLLRTCPNVNMLK